MNTPYRTTQASDDHAYTLSELRVAAMQESLEAVGRFDPLRARSRFLESFIAEQTTCLMIDDELAGFYVLLERDDHLWLNHFYIHPDNQGQGVGSHVIEALLAHAQLMQKPLRLMALKGSRSNQFYLSHGFAPIYQDEWDIVYQAPLSDPG